VTISTQAYPTFDEALYSKEIEDHMELVEELVHAFRSMVSNYGLLKQQPLGYVMATDLAGAETLISTLAKIGPVESIAERPEHCLRDITTKSGIELYLRVENLDKEGYLAKMTKKRAEFEKYIANVTAKIEKPGYDKTPEHIKKDNEERLKDTQAKLAVVLDSMEQVRNL
jgi:valyl-tRNA synthetase